MLLSRKLLNTFNPVFKNISTTKLESMFNGIGVEVESIFTFEKTDNLIVGEIKEVNKHPNSNKLNVCEVFFENKNHTIICGASNVRPGLKVIVAKVGTKMLDGRIIESKDLLGVKSNGMICAYTELTHRTEFYPTSQLDKIIELDDDAKLNDKSPLKYIGLDDEIWDLSIPSNRNELNGVLPLVLDLLAIYFPEVKFNINLKNIEKFPKSKLKIKVDKKICKFFGVIETNDVIVKESKWTVKSLLINSGIMPINSIVDITNLNTIITSNPSHAYDKDKISDCLEVKLVEKNTKILALNGKEYELKKDIPICIYSKNKIASVAGIIGLNDSAISNNTRSVVFELGNFNNLNIRKTSDTLGLRTNSSIINSKKIPLYISFIAFNYIIDLIKESNISIKAINYISNELNQVSIDIDENEIQTLLGQKFDVIKTLQNMGFKCTKKKVLVPLYREDIQNISDIVEEIVKKINVNNLEPKPIGNSLVDFESNVFEDTREFLERYFLNRGFSLVKTLNLSSIDNINKFNLFNTKKHIKILNPISSEREYFRNNLIQQHIEVIASNYVHKNNLLNIFEIQGLNYDNKWNQHLCLTLSTEHFLNKINNSKINIDLLFIKSILNDLSTFYNIGFEYKHIDKLDNAINFISINNGFEIYLNNKLVGYASQISPETLSEYKIEIPKPIYFVELIINELFDKSETKNIVVKDEKKEHVIKKLLTIIVDKNSSYKEYESIFAHYKNNLNLLDKFEVESLFLKDNKLSYTFSFEINQSKLVKKETSEINEILEKLISDLEKANAEIRR